MNIYVVIKSYEGSYPEFKKAFENYNDALKYKQNWFNNSKNITDDDDDDFELELEDIQIETVNLVKK